MPVLARGIARAVGFTPQRAQTQAGIAKRIFAGVRQGSPRPSELADVLLALYPFGVIDYPFG